MAAKEGGRFYIEGGKRVKEADFKKREPAKNKASKLKQGESK